MPALAAAAHCCPPLSTSSLYHHRTAQGLKGGAARYASWLQCATAGYRMALPGGELPGPPTPDDHSAGDPSDDTSSDDMSAELPCYLGMPEAAPSASQRQAAAAAASAAPAAPAPDGLQTFSAHFSSQCEHHLLPFYGLLKLAYLPAAAADDGGGAGSAGAAAARERAALAHVVEMFSRRLQVQERLTHQVADAGGWGHESMAGAG